MTQQPLTKSPEKTQRHVERRKTKLASAESFHGGRHALAQLQRMLGNRSVAQLIQAKAKQVTPERKIVGLQRKLTVGTADDQYDSRGNTEPVFTRSAQERADGQRLTKVPVKIQTNLTVNTPGDVYEQEADRIADQVMATPAYTTTGSAPRRIQCLSGQSNGRTDAVPPSVNQALASPGRPLDPQLRQNMEQRFGHDFSRVRVHSGAAAAQSAQDVNATAYTVGHNIVFGEGRFERGSREGVWLIAHELTHVIQQRAAMPVATRGPGVSPSRNVHPSALSAKALQRQVVDPRPLQIISKEAASQVRVSEWLVENRPGGGTARTELYWVDFRVDDKGVMTASVRTVSPDRAYRSGTLRFANEFRSALDHFQKSGVQVTEFEGDWSYMSKDEISENLKVFKESLASGMTREKAAQSTPTGKVLAASGFEVTHVENVPESQPHIAEEGVRRWRVRAVFRRPPPAPTLPPAPAQGGAVRGGIGPSARSAIGWGLAELAINYVLGQIAGRIIKSHQEEQVARTWRRLLPKVQEDLNLRLGDIEKLLRETNYQKTVYANVLMDMIVSQACWEGGCAQGYYGMDFVPPVKVSTVNINRMDTFSSIDPAPAGNIIHYPVTFSFAVAEPSATVLRDIRTIHIMLTRIRNDLKAVRGGTAGEAVALDHLGVALEAAEYTRPTVFQTRSAAERYRITAREVHDSRYVLEGQSNPAIEDLVKRLGSAQFLLLNALEDRWPIMVEEPGKSPG